MTETDLLLQVSSLVGVVVLYLITKFKPEGIKDIKNEILKLCESISGKGGFAERITRSETILDLFKANIAEVLHSPHTPDLDKVLDKIIKREPLTKEELIQTKELIIKIKDDPDIPIVEKIGYALILADCEVNIKYQK